MSARALARLAVMPGQFRIVVAKPGLDGHDSGVKVIARVLRDTGFEFIYTGLHQTPEQIADTTIQEDPDAVGLSCHSGAHMTLFPKVVSLLRERSPRHLRGARPTKRRSTRIRSTQSSPEGHENLRSPVRSAVRRIGPPFPRRSDPCFSLSSAYCCAGWSGSHAAPPRIATATSRSWSFVISSPYSASSVGPTNMLGSVSRIRRSRSQPLRRSRVTRQARPRCHASGGTKHLC